MQNLGIVYTIINAAMFKLCINPNTMETSMINVTPQILSKHFNIAIAAENGQVLRSYLTTVEAKTKFII